jgi:rhodanese-related sulfurtransferase
MAPDRRRRTPLLRTILGAMTDEATGQAMVTPARAAEMLASGEVQLIDVREADEWRVGRIEGATHMPLGTLLTRAGEIDRERPVIFQCRTGARSGMATEALRASGFDAYNLVGGLERWASEGLPVVPGGGAGARPDNS